MYENARFRAFSQVGLFLAGAFFLLAFRADAVKKDIIPGKVKAVGIPDPAFKAADKVHVHIEKPPACFAFDMTVPFRDMVKTIRAPGYLKTANLTHLC